jgi:hypothetical protein
MATVSSSDPPSTKMTSAGRAVWASMLAISCSTVACSSRTGITRLTGSSLRCEAWEEASSAAAVGVFSITAWSRTAR